MRMLYSVTAACIRYYKAYYYYPPLLACHCFLYKPINTDFTA